MSTEQIWQTDSLSLEATLQIASAIGARLRGGEVIELASDLGGGKTAFVRGLAAGMRSTDQVSSPSFTLTNEYRASELILYHYDFYRLVEPGILQAELTEVLANPQAITVIEWAEIVEDVLPKRRLQITITVTGETSRHFACTYPSSLAYLLEEATS